MLEIDGSFGEGGGQILRTSLALSLVTGRPFRILGIRARRKRPGLLRQHLTAVHAARDVGRARVAGAALGSTELTFVPGAVHGGRYHFSVGTAGSTTLVLQTVLPALATADEPSEIVLEGGTHNPFAPPSDFLKLTFLPLLERMGTRVSLELVRHGFFPRGGGRLEVSVEPTARLEPLDVPERGSLREVRARSILSNLPESIARRELGVLATRLSIGEKHLRVQRVQSAGPGNVILIEIESDRVTEVITAFGEKGKPAEKVAEQAATRALRYLHSDVPVGEHLADQLLLPMAIAGRGAFRTSEPTRHTTTNAQVLKRFLDIEVEISPGDAGSYRIAVGAR